MQNQDPTADVDPNEYINQLVNVNSLEQLISINQTLSTALGGTAAAANGAPATAQAAGTASSSTNANASDASAQTQPAQSGSASAPAGAATTLPGAIHAAAAELAPSNLGIPAANPAAQRVAQSLSGRLGVQ
jgi:flagellar basal-body rod modification protein FlgD